VEVTGVDTSLSAKASHVGKVRKALAEAKPPYTAADVLALPALLAQQTPWAAGRKVTVGEIEKHIDLVRNKAAPIPSGSMNGSGRQDRGAEMIRMGQEAASAKEGPQ
jgi:hypothetical protein